MPIPSYEDWKTKTNLGRLHMRSKLLDKVDDALKAYWKLQSDTNKVAIRTALDAWLASKDNGVTSRNKNGIVDELKAAVQPYRAAVVAWTPPPLPGTPVAGEIYLSQSFEFSKSLARQQVPEAFGRAKRLIDVAYRNVSLARGPGWNRDVYETWFGAYDATRYAKVVKNIRAIYDALFLKPVLLYYRGDGVSGPNDCSGEAGDLTPGSFFGAAWVPQNLPASLDRRFTYIFVGRAFFTSGVYEQDSTGGVIIHELTHAICGTDDVVYRGVTTYGQALCERLALDRPDLAINNADSYEYLCENYQDRLYQPKVKVLNLPAKASVNIPMRAPI